MKVQLFFPFFLSLWRDLPSGLLLSFLLISLTFYSPLLSSSLTFLFIFCFLTFNIFLFIRLRSRAYHNPPTPLVTGYYNCTYTVRDGIFSSSSIKYITPYLLTMFSWLLLCHFLSNDSTSLIWFFLFHNVCFAILHYRFLFFLSYFSQLLIHNDEFKLKSHLFLSKII